MDVGTLCTREVATILPTASVLQVAQLMRERHVGDLVVAEGGIPLGIVTDRDIVVSVVAMGLTNPETIDVRDLLVGELITIDEGASVQQAVSQMSVAGVRRLPVVDSEGVLVGILTLDDLLEVASDDLAALARVPRGQRGNEARNRDRLGR